MADRTSTLTLADGRRLAWEEAGDPDGAPIMFFHGSPGSRLQRRVFMTDLRGVRMIAPDRPGCGFSEFQPGRTISDWVDDIDALVDHLDLDRFSVLGFSGGTPYAVMVAASELPVGALGIVSGDPPPGQVADVPQGLGDVAASRPRIISLLLRLARSLARWAPDFTANRATSVLSEPDQVVVSEPRIRAAFLEMLRDSLRQGPQGALLDLQLAAQAWEVIPPRDEIPIRIWHGEADTDAPVSIARYLEARLPGAELTTYPGEGHVSVFVHNGRAIIEEMAASLMSDRGV